MSGDTESLSALDRFIARTSPMVMVPKESALKQMEEPGHRYLAARDGTYLEVSRQWCSAVLPIGRTVVEMPFGAVQPRFALKCGRAPASLLKEFRRLAQAACPLEAAAWITWTQPAHEGTAGTWALRVLEATSVSTDHIAYVSPELAAREHLVVDIHSHGKHPAYFSRQDDEDDSEGSHVAIAVVLGNVDAERSYAMRLCAGGVFTSIGELHEVFDADR